ncbi:MAG: non-canonical purine NTP pyrophosphatase [Pseudomonadota bacterium]
MVDLIFFSTNRTKITHFRYLGSKFGLTVRSFKEVNYYASYNEPKVDDRAELLRLSYQSALQQWQRRQGKFDDDTATFFFEDTSVRIDALSQYAEIPGVNIKFWMKEMSFEKLDAELKRNGNNRKASVRSDIVMHLPKKWKELIGTTDDFLWVFGEVKGNIADTEELIDMNLVYPWLDDKSFNRWFVPTGAVSPISALNIDEANNFDFRRLAFLKIVEKLGRLQFFQSNEVQSALQLELPRVQSYPSIFVICGPTCAGKTTTAGWMTERYNIPHIEASDFMYKAFWERHGLRSATKIGDFAEAALISQPDIVASQIIAHIQKKQYSSAVVTGFRAAAEVQIFNAGISADIQTELIFLDAAKAVRLERAILRNRDQITEEKFQKRNDQEERMGVNEIAQASSATHISNDGDIQLLYSVLRTKYRAIFKMQRSNIGRPRFDSNLEPLILSTLFDHLSVDLWLTTTEIAAALNKKFLENKSKNNISRYFNQGYHPYYEVRARENNGIKTRTVEYKLSATGISETKLLHKFGINLLPLQRSPRRKTSRQLALPFTDPVT